MLSVGLIILGVLRAPTTAVVELRLQGEEASQSLGQELAKSVGAPAPSDTAAAISRQLPSISENNKAESIIEADRMVDSGRDLYTDGRLPEAKKDLSRAREILTRTLEAFDEERKGAEALFRAEMYLAFALRTEGGVQLQQAAEVLRDAIRTFPSTEPNYSEYGPENLKFYHQVRSEMDRQPTAHLRVEAGREAAAIYLNGRLLGTTPLDIPRIYPGQYRISARRGTDKSRVHMVEIRAGDNDVRIEVDFENALKTDGALALVYANAAERHRRYRHDVLRLARLLSLDGVVLFWSEGRATHLAFVDKEGNAHEATAGVAGAAVTASELVAGKTGELVVDEERPQRIWTWVFGGVAIGAIVGGVLLGSSASSDFDSLRMRYPNHMLDGPGLDIRDSASTKQTIGNVLIDVGIASVVASVALYWYEGRENQSTRAHIVPFTGPQTAGALLRVRF